MNGNIIINIMIPFHHADIICSIGILCILQSSSQCWCTALITGFSMHSWHQFLHTNSCQLIVNDSLIKNLSLTLKY